MLLHVRHKQMVYDEVGVRLAFLMALMLCKWAANLMHSTSPLLAGPDCT